MLKITLIGSTILFLSVSTYVSANPCGKAIMDDDFQKAYETCIVSKGETIFDRKAKGILKKYFGTYSNKSSEAELLQMKAESGNAGFQFMWSEVLRTAYFMDYDWVDETTSQEVLQIQSEYEFWLREAAKGGFMAAMQGLIRSFLSPYSTGSDEDKKLMQIYAKVLVENNVPNALELIAQINAKSSHGEIELEFRQQVLNYRSLPTQNIFQLARSLAYGRFHSDEGSFDFNKDEAKGKELYLYLIEKRRHPESAFNLAKLYGKTNRDSALKYFNVAANYDFPKALGWLGDYHSCIGDNKSARKYLLKSKRLGYLYADDSLGEIKAFGVPNTCNGGWID